MADVYQRISPSDQWIYDDDTGDLIGVRRRGMNGADLRVDGLSTGQLADLTGASTATPTSSSTVLGETGGTVKRFAGTTLVPFLSVRWFGAVGDGVTDDTTAIQAAAAALENGQELYFPPTDSPSGADTVYLISGTITFSAADLKIVGAARGEYGVCIRTLTPSLDMFKFTSYGATVRDLVFWGEVEEANTEWATARGIVFDRRGLSTAEAMSNLDHEVHNCGFINLDTGVYGRGRNVLVKGCLFSSLRLGVHGEHFVDGTGTTAQFRGWRIIGNRFHGIGAPNTQSSAAFADSWCILMPEDDVGALTHIEVSNNNSDFSWNFYKGDFVSSRMTDNILYWHFGYMLYTGTSATAKNSGTHSSHIQGNQYHGKATAATNTYRQEPLYAIHSTQHQNLHISGNTFRNVGRTFINVELAGVNVVANTFIDGNIGYSTRGDHPVARLCGDDSSFIANTVFSEQATATHSYGLYVLPGTKTGTFRLEANNIEPGRLGDIFYGDAVAVSGTTNKATGEFSLITPRGTHRAIDVVKADSASTYKAVGRFYFREVANTAGGEKTSLEFWTMEAGTLTLQGYFDSTGGLVLPPRATAPASPPTGCLAIADGSGWNPGSGAGLYRWSGAAWVFVG